MVKVLEIEERVEFTGSVPDPSEHYARAEVFCMPSRFEAFGIVLAEAAAYELPLSGLSTCVAAKALIPDGCGALADKESSKSLAEALRPLMAMTSEERRAMGKKARAFFIENYSPEAVFGAWERTVIRTVEAVRQNGITQLDRILRDRPKNVKADEFDAGIMNLEFDLAEWTKKAHALKRKHDVMMQEFGAKILKKGRGQ
jgi:hypothetical protein